MPTNETLDTLGKVVNIGQQLTVTGLLLWLVYMLVTGKLVRREELDKAVEREKTCGEVGNWWRDEYMKIAGVARDSLSTLQANTAGFSVLKEALERGLSTLAERLPRGRT